jgi:hypothetical protein
MRALRRAVPGLTAMAIVGVLGAGTASAAQFDSLAYSVSALQPGSPVQIYYTGGVSTDFGGTVTVSSGKILALGLLGNAMFVQAGAPGPLSANIIHFLGVSSAPITGTASIPAGATVVVENEQTNKQYTLVNGQSFSIPSGFGVGAKSPKGGTRTVRCRGAARSCTAAVSIAGGASNRKLVIKLTDTNLRLKSVTAVPKRSERAYLLTGGHFALGGSEYIVTLNAVKSNPKGAHVNLRFAS